MKDHYGGIFPLPCCLHPLGQLYLHCLFEMVYNGVCLSGLLSLCEPSQLSLFGMAAHQCSGVWEETSEEGANRTVSCQFCGQMRD